MARLAVLSGAHLYVDMLLAFLPPLLPLLVEEMGLSLFMAGLLVSTMTLANGMIQPFFGHWADRLGRAWWLGASLIAIGAGGGLFGIGIGRGYGILLALAAFVGIAGAAFHPTGMVMVPRALQGRPGAAMSVWSLGGTAGAAAAPLVTLGLVNRMGFDGLMWLAAPGALLAAAGAAAGVHRLMPPRRGGGDSGNSPSGGGEAPGAAAGAPVTAADRQKRNRWLTLLAGATAARSTALVGLNTFIPVYYTKLGYTPAAAGNMLVLYLLAGAAGSVAGAFLADAVGRKPVTVWSQIVGAVSVAGFALTGGAAAVIFLILAALGLFATFSVVILYGQELMPHRPAMASGVLGGFAWGIGSLALGPLGSAADTFGLDTALQIMAAAALAGLPLLLTLPETWQRRPGPSGDETPEASAEGAAGGH